MYGSSRIGVRKFDNTERVPIMYTGATPTAGETSNIPAGTNVPYKGTRGQKFFELSNHLGNVLVTITDQKIWTVDAPRSQ